MRSGVTWRVIKGSWVVIGGVWGLSCVLETAQVELRSGRVQAPARGARARSSAGAGCSTATSATVGTACQTLLSTTSQDVIQFNSNEGSEYV